MEKINSRDMSRELACFRFATIAPVAQGTFPDAPVAAYRRRAAGSPIAKPGGTANRDTGKEANGNDSD